MPRPARLSDVRTAEEIRRDLATEEGRGGSKRLSPIGRLVADVAPLLAEVERLCNSLEACRNAGQSLQTERDDEYERADNLRHDLRQEIASANELHARLEAVRVGIELHRRNFVDKAWSDANLSGASAEALRDVETQAQSDWQTAWPWFAAALSKAPDA